MRARLRGTVKWLLTAGGVAILAIGIGGSVLAGRTLSDQAYDAWLNRANSWAIAFNQYFDDLLHDARTVVRALSAQASPDDASRSLMLQAIQDFDQDRQTLFEVSESAHVQHIPREQREAFESEFGRPFHQLGNGAAAAPEAFEYFVVTQSSTNAHLLSNGTDLATEPALRAAVATAFNRPNTVVASPVFERNGRQWMAVAERPAYPGRQQQDGLVVALLDFSAIMTQIRQQIPDGLQLHLTQRAIAPEQFSLIDNITIAPADAANAIEVLSFDRTYGQAQWTFNWYVFEHFAGGPATAMGSIVMLVGVMLTLVLGSLVTVLTLNNAAVRQRDAVRTRELEAARDEAEAANRTKSEFLASVSHELRTPLNAIIGFSEFIMSELRGPIGQPRYSEYARDIHTSGRHLLGVINSIIDLSAIESGQFQLKDEAVSMAETIDAVQRIIGLAAEKRGITLECETPSKMPRLLADQIAIEQILLNLGSNAVQFTPKGGTVTFAAGMTGNSVWLLVRDTGVGMDSSEQNRAMQPFGQVVTPMNRVSEGAGLGLPIAKELAQRHGAVFELESAPGMGTQIRIRFDSSRTLPDPSGAEVAA